MQFDVLCAALDQAVDVEVARRDGDRALRQNARARGGTGSVDIESIHVRSVGEFLGVVGAGLVVNQRVEQVEVDQLPRVLASVEPVVAVEREVLLRKDLDGCAADLARHRDAALEVLDRDLAGLVDHVTHQVQVLVDGGRWQGAEVVGAAQLVLNDGDRLGAGIRAYTRLRDVVEVHIARLQHRVLAVDLRHHLGVANHGVVNCHGERRVVKNVDLGAGAGQHIGVDAGKCQANRQRVGLDKHRAWCGIHVGHLHEQDVEFAPDQPIAVNQAQLFERVVDQLQLHLITRHRLGVVAVTADPVFDLLTLLQQDIAEILVDELGRVDLDRLDDEEFIDQAVAYDGRGIAVVDHDLCSISNDIALAIERTSAAGT